ncbi:response regulator transcription factor [Haloferula chungangensis]|uniref:Response regulator transcription factor n=1 Tax=Haloferula chungangensis TaxID=1048331 RepID=A0ABW2LDL3_9BACT
MKILIVEDDAKTAQAIRSGLKAEGYEAFVALTGNDGFERLSSEIFDLVVLDWMLPGKDGISILQSLQDQATKPPILLLTARDHIDDRVLGLDNGADDYLVKPFAFAELLARLRALLRRSGREEVLQRNVADLAIDLQGRRAWRANDEVILTPKEFDLLAYLMRFSGQIVTREMLAREVWREPNRSTPLDNVIDVHLARLRKKIDSEGHTPLVQTVRGVGFVLRSTNDNAR